LLPKELKLSDFAVLLFIVDKNSIYL